MEPQAGRRISPFRAAKRSNDSLKRTTRRSRVHVQTIGLNAETKKCRHRADGEICLLTFPFIGLLRNFNQAKAPSGLGPHELRGLFEGSLYRFTRSDGDWSRQASAKTARWRLMFLNGMWSKTPTTTTLRRSAIQTCR